MSSGPPPESSSGRTDPHLLSVAEFIAERNGTAMAVGMVVGMAGGVAVGKSTTAAALSTLLAERFGIPTAVVSSDGFLMPNEVLADRSLLHRKGFPESYDGDAISVFLAAARRGDSPLSVPIYDHLRYDVLPERLILDPTPVVVFEGVNALHFSTELDTSIYIDAEESSMRRWYLDRVLGLRHRSVSDPSAFFAAFASLSDAEFAARAESIWEAVNLPNLIECIGPTSATADIVITKALDHSIRSVIFR